MVPLSRPVTNNSFNYLQQDLLVCLVLVHPGVGCEAEIDAGGGEFPKGFRGGVISF
jgi:hypothetical protein